MQRGANGARRNFSERPPQELKICAVCGKPIFDLTGAVAPGRRRADSF